MTHMTKVVNIDVRDVVIIKGDDESRGIWKIGIVELYIEENIKKYELTESRWLKGV